MTQTVAQFYTDLNTLTKNKFSGVTDAEKLRWLNRARTNRYLDLKYLCPNTYDKNTALTPSGREYTLPSNINLDDYNDLLVYGDSDFDQIIPDNQFRVRGRKLRWAFDTTQTIYIEYSASPSDYTSTGDTIEETESARAKEILQSEVETVRDTAIRQGQFSPQAQSAQVRANQVS